MAHITARHYRILADQPDVYRFMTEIYEWDWRNGVPAPFLEYALSSNWMDTSFSHRWRDLAGRRRNRRVLFQRKSRNRHLFQSASRI